MSEHASHQNVSIERANLSTQRLIDFFLHRFKRSVLFPFIFVEALDFPLGARTADSVTNDWTVIRAVIRALSPTVARKWLKPFVKVVFLRTCIRFGPTSLLSASITSSFVARPSTPFTLVARHIIRFFIPVIEAVLIRAANHVFASFLSRRVRPIFEITPSGRCLPLCPPTVFGFVSRWLVTSVSPTFVTFVLRPSLVRRTRDFIFLSRSLIY